MSLFVKDPQARVDHAIDWSAYLAGQSLVASLWRRSISWRGAAKARRRRW
nr:hypothetical protein [Sphingobium cupriresistens]